MKTDVDTVEQKRTENTSADENIPADENTSADENTPADEYISESRKDTDLASTLKYAFTASLPVMAGYVVLGIGFGLLLYNAGYNFIWAFFMSLTVYAGSMQFVGVSLISAGAGFIATALTTVMVNARHLFYGISMVDRYRDTGRRKPYLIFALTDETYSLVCSPKLPERVDLHDYYFYLSLFDHSYWVIGSTLGALVGSILPFSTKGVDFSMTALFIVVFVEQWESAKTHIPALLGLSVSVICLLIFGSSNFLIPTMIAITIGLFLLKPLIEKQTADFSGKEKEGKA